MKIVHKYLRAIALVLLLVFPVQAAEVVTFYHTDPVGTPLAITDGDGQKVWEADYKPFGEEYSIDGTQENNRRFVGKEQDAETGLDYFGARYMAVETGRFLAVDPVRAVDGFSGGINASLLANPQRLNAYAYSLNNPYRYIDPDGQMAGAVIKWTRKALNHIAKRHVSRMAFRSKSKFVKPSSMIKNAERVVKNPDKVTRQINGRMVFEKDFGRTIGTRGETIQRVVLEADGTVVTTFPSLAYRESFVEVALGAFGGFVDPGEAIGGDLAGPESDMISVVNGKIIRPDQAENKENK